MTRSVITTDGAPAAIGPYAQGVRVGNLIFTAGQGALDPIYRPDRPWRNQGTNGADP